MRSMTEAEKRGEDPWQKGKSRIECNLYMLEHGIYADVTFIVSFVPVEPGNDQGGLSGLFHAHKLLLMSRSSVFQELLTHFLSKDTNKMVVNDVHPDAFRQMLRFIYADEVNLQSDTVMYVLNAAKKYQIFDLEEICIRYLDKNISPENACTFLDQAIYFRETTLSALCMTYVRVFTEKCVNAKSFPSIRSDTLGEVLDAKTISCSEAILFDACHKWGVKKCEEQKMPCTGDNVRKVLGSLLYQVRLHLVSMDEFEIISDTGVVEGSDAWELWRYLKKKSNPSGDVDQVVLPAKFSQEPRFKNTDQPIYLQPEIYEQTITHQLDYGQKYVFKFSLESDFPVTVLSLSFAGTETDFEFQGMQAVLSDGATGKSIEKSHYGKEHIMGFIVDVDRTPKEYHLEVVHENMCEERIIYRVDPTPEICMQDELVKITVKSVGPPDQGMPVIGLKYKFHE